MHRISISISGTKYQQSSPHWVEYWAPEPVEGQTPTDGSQFVDWSALHAAVEGTEPGNYDRDALPEAAQAALGTAGIRRKDGGGELYGASRVHIVYSDHSDARRQMEADEEAMPVRLPTIIADMTMDQIAEAHGVTSSTADLATAHTAYHDYADSLLAEVRRRAETGDAEASAWLAGRYLSPEWHAAQA